VKVKGTDEYRKPEYHIYICRNAYKAICSYKKLAVKEPIFEPQESIFLGSGTFSYSSP